MVTAKKAMTNRTKSKFTSPCPIAVKTNFLLLLFPGRFAHARYSSRMTDRFLYCGDYEKPKSGKIKGHSLCCMYLIDRFSQLLRWEVALHFINTWDIDDLTFEYYWKQLNYASDFTCHGCVYPGSFVLDYHALYLQHFTSTVSIE